jgi:hypothetical protein
MEPFIVESASLHVLLPQSSAQPSIQPTVADSAEALPIACL